MQPLLQSKVTWYKACCNRAKSTVWWFCELCFVKVRGSALCFVVVFFVVVVLRGVHFAN